MRAWDLNKLLYLADGHNNRAVSSNNIKSEAIPNKMDYCKTTSRQTKKDVETSSQKTLSSMAGKWEMHSKRKSQMGRNRSVCQGSNGLKGNCNGLWMIGWKWDTVRNSKSLLAKNKMLDHLPGAIPMQHAKMTAWRKRVNLYGIGMKLALVEKAIMFKLFYRTNRLTEWDSQHL